MNRKNVNYYNKVKREFESKGWDFSKVLGRANPFTLVNNETSMANFKKRVKKERAYNKEREKIVEEAKKIWGRIRKNNKKRNRKYRFDIIKELKNQGYSKRAINKILDIQKKYGIHNSDLLNKNTVRKYSSKYFIEALVNEFEYKKGDENLKKAGAFSRFSGIPRVKERLDKLEKMVQKDENAIHHIEYVLQRFMDETLLQRYEEFKSKHGRYISPPEQFYVDLVDDLITMYSKYVK